MLPSEIFAPDFELYSTPDQKLKRSELKDRKVIPAFCPADWSPVCDDKMALYSEMENWTRTNRPRAEMLAEIHRPLVLQP
jgi:peroxiredoxin